MNKVYMAFEKWMKVIHQTEHYRYQKLISQKILKAYLFDRLRGRSPEIAIEISRQAGKTTSVKDVVAFLMCWYKPIRIGIFAPQREQAKTDFDRLKQTLAEVTKVTGEFKPEERNANTLKIENGSECYIFPVTPTSHPESKTLDLIIVEEAQSINDHEFMNDVRPMGASTNAPIIFIGSAGYNICYFYRLIQRDSSLKFDCNTVFRDKREMFEKTGDDFHLNYETFVNAEKLLLGEDSDEFRVPYLLEWKLGGGQFATAEQIDAVVGTHSRVYQEKKSECFVGIDTAKNPDSTVVTILRWLIERDDAGNEIKREKQLINWLELRGDNYKDQFDIIHEFIKHYNVVAIAIDSTGQGDFMPDMFERETRWCDENNGLYRIKFSSVSKDTMYKNLTVVLKNLLTKIPRLETKEGEKFREQMLDLQKEYKGELLSVHHPNSPDAHDDYPDSWALAELAFAKYQEKGEPKIRLI